MKMILAIFVTVLILTGCKKDEVVAEIVAPIEKNTVKNDSTSTPKQAIANIDTSELAQRWLKVAVEHYFSNFQKLNGSYKHLVTPSYAEMKHDASNLELDGGMSEEAFIQKYGNKDLHYKGLREGFMIAGNEFGKIQVRSSILKDQTSKGYLLSAVIDDLTFGSSFVREVLVIKNGNSFLIDNVYEMDNIFKGQFSSL